MPCLCHPLALPCDKCCHIAQDAPPPPATTPHWMQAWLQELSWTQAGLEAAIERRDYRLRRAQFALSTELFARSRLVRHAQRSVGHHPFLAALGLAEPSKHAADGGPASKGEQQEAEAHIPDQREQQRRPQEPMFCLERAVRLWSWAQYAYRHWVSLVLPACCPACTPPCQFAQATCHMPPG